MDKFSPAELTANYSAIGAKKASAPAWRMLLLGIPAGFLIGMGSAVANTAAHAIDNVSAARIICGLLFPFGLGMVILIGAELFTGNCLIVISALDRKASAAGMLKNWLLVYFGNAIGAMALAAGCVASGQLNYSGGALAAYTIKAAAAKCSLPFASAVIMGVLCNVLVCVGVLCALTARDTAGTIAGAFIPVAFFVICGFEHSIANMFSIPAGLFAAGVPAYSIKAAELGIDASALTWGGFVFKNLLPVTIGNIIGGAAVGALMWACHLRGQPSAPSRKR